MVAREIDYYPPSNPFELYGKKQQQELSSQEIADKIVRKFKNPRNRQIVNDCIDHVITPLYDRWQFGYAPFLRYKDNGIQVEFPTLSKLSSNNRGYHSLLAADIGLDTAVSWEISEKDLLLIALSHLSHDFTHPAFSHAGEDALHAIYKESAEGNAELYRILRKFNLHLSHEERLQVLLSNRADYPPLHFLERLSDDEINKLKTILQERGPLGELLKLSDTCSYLNHDSHYFGWEAPHFEWYLSEMVYPRAEGLAIDKTHYDYEVAKRFLQYRYFLYSHQYQHPLHQLIAAMQTRSLYYYLTSASTASEMRQRVQGLIEDSDYTNLQNLRRWSLVDQRMENASFFFYPERSFRVVGTTDRSNSTTFYCPIISPKNKSLYFDTGDNRSIAITVNPEESPRMCRFIGRDVLPIEFLRAYPEVIHLYSLLGKDSQLALPFLDSSSWEYDVKSAAVARIPQYTVAINDLILGDLP